MIEYLKEQIRLLDTSSNKPSISTVKKLSHHDFIVQGKRFQIKQPPVLTIKNNTRVVDIIVKVGVSQQNLKEFLQSVINEVVQANHQLESGVSMTGISGNLGPASSLFSKATYNHHRRQNSDCQTFDDQRSYDSNHSNLKLGSISLGNTKLKLSDTLKLNLKQ